MTGLFFGKVKDLELKSVELPEGSIISGAPELSFGVLWRSEDGFRAIGVGRATPGKYQYTTENEEVALCLEGCAKYTRDDGALMEMVPGDVAVIPAGKTMTFEVTQTFLDFWVVNSDKRLTI